MRYLLLVITLTFICCGTEADLLHDTSIIIVSKVQPVTNMPLHYRGFFVDVHEVIRGEDFGCCLKVYDTEFKSTFPPGWSNMYSGRIKFEIEKKQNKWVIVNQN